MTRQQRIERARKAGKARLKKMTKAERVVVAQAGGAASTVSRLRGMAKKRVSTVASIATQIDTKEPAS